MAMRSEEWSINIYSATPPAFPEPATLPLGAVSQTNLTSYESNAEPSENCLKAVGKFWLNLIRSAYIKNLSIAILKGCKKRRYTL